MDDTAGRKSAYHPRGAYLAELSFDRHLPKHQAERAHRTVFHRGIRLAGAALRSDETTNNAMRLGRVRSKPNRA
jgi:hypothetical protein